MLKRLISTHRREGSAYTFKKVIKYPFILWKKYNFEKTLSSLKTTEDKFTWVYKNNYWVGESPSGSGSSLDYTKNLRKELPEIIRNFNIKSIFDAPCGDFNWMNVLLPSLDVDYIGADIVQDLVDVHNTNYKNDSTKFIKLNLITNSFPDADLMICRDCFIHLSFQDIQSVLTNFKNSKIPYLLISNVLNKNNFQNKNINTGDYRIIDIFSQPLNFPKNPLLKIEDWVFPDLEREMCLFSREQILSIEVN